MAKKTIGGRKENLIHRIVVEDNTAPAARRRKNSAKFSLPLKNVSSFQYHTDIYRFSDAPGAKAFAEAARATKTAAVLYMVSVCVEDGILEKQESGAGETEERGNEPVSRRRDRRTRERWFDHRRREMKEMDTIVTVAYRRIQQLTYLKKVCWVENPRRSRINRGVVIDSKCVFE